MNKNKRRGDELEREVVNLLKDKGAYRTLTSGARNEGQTWDVTLGDFKIECKRKKSGFKFLYDSIEGCDILVIRQDRSERLWVLTEETVLKLLGMP